MTSVEWDVCTEPRDSKRQHPPRHSVFTLLPPDNRYRSICCCSTRLQSSFITQAVTPELILNIQTVKKKKKFFPVGIREIQLACCCVMINEPSTLMYKAGVTNVQTYSTDIRHEDSMKTAYIEIYKHHQLITLCWWSRRFQRVDLVLKEKGKTFRRDLANFYMRIRNFSYEAGAGP